MGRRPITCTLQNVNESSKDQHLVNKHTHTKTVYNPIQTQIVLVEESRCDLRSRFRECAFQSFVFTHQTMANVMEGSGAHREKKIICLIPNQNYMRVSCFRFSQIQSNFISTIFRWLGIQIESIDRMQTYFLNVTSTSTNRRVKVREMFLLWVVTTPLNIYLCFRYWIWPVECVDHELQTDI